MPLMLGHVDCRMQRARLHEPRGNTREILRERRLTPRKARAAMVARLSGGLNEADARGEGAAQRLSEGQILRGIDVVVDDVRVGTVGDVLGDAAQAEVLAAE